MPLILQLARRADGLGALTLIRDDGTRTWQRQSDRHAQFFAQHDLTHFAVESELGLRDSFYGLVARGWNFADFAQPWPKGPLPEEALWTETVVGMLDVERATIAAAGAPLAAEEFAALVAAKLAQSGRDPARVLDGHMLTAIRARRDALLADWRAVAAGSRLELRFEPESGNGDGRG